MASWSELLKSLNDQDDPGWLDRKLKEHLDAISKQRGDAAVIFYASAFLQKAADNVSITREDINGFMNALCTLQTLAELHEPLNFHHQLIPPSISQQLLSQRAGSQLAHERPQRHRHVCGAVQDRVVQSSQRNAQGPSERDELGIVGS